MSAPSKNRTPVVQPVAYHTAFVLHTTTENWVMFTLGEFLIKFGFEFFDALNVANNH
jgi:hypothetical protein